MSVMLSFVAAAEDRHIPVDIMIFLVFMVAALTPDPAANAAPDSRFCADLYRPALSVDCVTEVK